MAEIVGGLFGVTPETLMAQREAALAQQAQNYAQLSPEQAAISGAYMTGGRLGSALGGLMGAQDPEMMRIQQRQSMLQNLDLSNPESLKSGIQQAMQNKDYQLVSELTNRYQASAKAALEGRKTEAEISAKLGEKLTPEQKNAAGLADAAGLQRGTQEWQNAYSKALSGLTNKNEPTAVVETADGVFLVNKVTGERISRVGSAPQRGTRIDIAPEIKQAPDIVGAVGAFDKATEKEVAMMESAGLAKQLINQTAKSNNSQAWEAARTTVAKAVGENKLSNEDIRRTGVDPRLVEGALDWVNKKTSGVPNADIQKQLFVLSSVLENNAKARYDAKAGRTRAAAEATGFKGNVQTYFPTAAERSKAAAPNAVDWSSLK